MAERTAPARHPAEQRGFLAKTSGNLIQVLLLLALSLMFSIAAEWIGMAFFWPDQGRRHSEAMLDAELRHLDRFRESILVEPPARFARDTATLFHKVLYQKSGIEAGLLWLAESPPNPGQFWRNIALAYRITADYLLAAMTITQVFAVRLCVLVLSLPAYALLGLVAFTDGLAERDLRRWGGGRESSFVYHWAMRLVAPTFVAPWILYLSVPFSVHPNWVVLPFAILFALLVAVVTSTFKKYL
ncbi:MAG: TIGR03747 family integrating conjugative element membrane protein [Methylococcaceae bacterium]|nr:TIGR03747 family integrating conjugative element membrane protein [Methylococcaceae bacterium]